MTARETPRERAAREAWQAKQLTRIETALRKAGDSSSWQAVRAGDLYDFLHTGIHAVFPGRENVKAYRTAMGKAIGRGCERITYKAKVIET